jgi:hypothetical protein
MRSRHLQLPSPRAIGLLVPALLAPALALQLGLGALGPNAPVAPTLSPADADGLARDLVAASLPPSPRALPRLSAAGGALPAVGPAPASATAAEIVLAPADVGPGYAVVSSAESIRFGVSVRVQTLVRGGRRGSYVEPDGTLYVRSFAVVAPSARDADEVYDRVSGGLAEAGFQEVPIPAVAERSRGMVAWGTDPFDLAAKAVVFRTRSVLAWVVVASYEAPTDMENVLPLARTMAARAAR